eukprot:evm.model.scf_4117.1 EVM.evm.TU.scf_4117.1   scf_4117:3706-5208(-)
MGMGDLMQVAGPGYVAPSRKALYAEPAQTSGVAWVPMSMPMAPPVYVPGQVPYDGRAGWGGLGAKPAWDMDSLKAAIHHARAGQQVPGTGSTEVRHAIETASFRPREAAFTALINLCGRLRDSAKAFEVFQTMQDYKGVRPNTYTYSSLISACSSAGDWGKAMEVFALMKQAAAKDRGCRPNEVTYSALITACERGGRFADALRLYDEMLEAGIFPDKVTFCSALVACQKSEKWARVEQIVEDMHGRGMAATSSIYFELLQNYGRQADWSKGLDLFLTMQMMGHEVDKHCCRALMSAFEASGRYAMALQLLDAMENEIPADHATYNSAIRTLAAAGRWREAADVVHNIMSSGMQPDREAVATAVEACVAQGHKEEAWRLVEAVEAHGIVVEEGVKASAE